jgi:hypothetical protein
MERLNSGRVKKSKNSKGLRVEEWKIGMLEAGGWKP